MSRIMLHPKYELTMHILGILNLFFLTLKEVQYEINLEYKNRIRLQLAINGFFLAELVLFIAVHGKQAYSKAFRIWPETVCQLLNVYLMINFFIDYDQIVARPRWKTLEFSYDRYTLGRLVEITLFIRILGILTLMYELRSMRLIIETMRNMLRPMVQLMGVLFVVFYIFSVAGMLLFGGMRKEDFPSIVKDGTTPRKYFLMNYNDLMYSIVSLFSLLVVNNWMVQVNMYV